MNSKLLRQIIGVISGLFCCFLLFAFMFKPEWQELCTTDAKYAALYSFLVATSGALTIATLFKD